MPTNIRYYSVAQTFEKWKHFQPDTFTTRMSLKVYQSRYSRSGVALDPNLAEEDETHWDWKRVLRMQEKRQAYKELVICCPEDVRHCAQ